MKILTEHLGFVPIDERNKFKDKNGKKILTIVGDIKKLFNSEILVIFSHNSSPPNWVGENKLNIDNGLKKFFKGTPFNYQNIWDQYEF